MTVHPDDWLVQFRARRPEHAFQPYDELHSADRWHAGRALHAKAILAGDWQWKGRPSVSLQPPIDWDRLCASDRSWHLALHSWEPLAPLLAAYDRAGDQNCLELALDLAADWLRRFPVIDKSASPFAWYDLAVGARAYRLAFLLDVTVRGEGHSDDLVALLLKGLLLHIEALADPESFASHSNHGFYQVIGQLAISRRFPEVPQAVEAGLQARTRLDGLLKEHFTSEGVHKEHSPHYHDLILIPLRALRKAKLIEEPSLEQVCERIESALAWFITPGGRYAMFGDTSHQVVTLEDVDDVTSGSLKFALSAGRTGSPPRSCVKGFEGSGYVIFRDRWPNGKDDFADCSYLAQTCAFHSRVHKHADDLSVVWYDCGCEILTDAGRFGYAGKTKPDSELFAEGFWYSDPRRIYVESTRAHNTVEIDGRSNPRRGVEPYGSALTQWGERGEIRFSESRVQWGELSHTRLLLFLPRSWLLVIDNLVDSAGKPHDFTQRFHLAPELELVEASRPGVIAAELPSSDRLHAAALLPQAFVEPVRGVADPQLLGWISRRDGELESQWTFGWGATEVPSHNFATLLCFSQETPRIDQAENATSADAKAGHFAWNADGVSHSISFERIPRETFEIEYLGDEPSGPCRER